MGFLNLTYTTTLGSQPRLYLLLQTGHTLEGLNLRRQHLIILLIIQVIVLKQIIKIIILDEAAAVADKTRSLATGLRPKNRDDIKSHLYDINIRVTL